MRDLYVENWPPMPLGEFARKLPATPVPAAPVVNESKPQPTRKVADSKELVVSGVITQISRPINPINAPYEDALLYGKIRITKLEVGSYSKPEAIVVFLAMRKRVLLPGAGHQVGDAVRLKMVLFQGAPESIRGMQRSDDTEDFDLPPYYVLEEIP